MTDLSFLKRWMGVSLFFHVLTAYFSVGYHSADEQFQVLEFLSYKLGDAPVSALAVEFGERMRPWMQPAIYYGIAKAWRALGVDNPFFLAFLFRLFAGLMGWLSTVGLALCSRVWFESPKSQRLAILLLSMTWFLPAFHVRPSSESLGASFFYLGITLLTLLRDRGWAWIAAGALFGMGFESRFQMGLMIAGAGAWVLLREPSTFALRARRVGLLSLGFAVLFAAGRVIDAWGHGDWAMSPWNYVQYNLIRGEVSRYGRAPWWDLFRMAFTESWPFLGLIVALSSILAWARRPSHLLTWSHVPFFLVHEWIAHKELRFFFPIAAAWPILGAQVIDSFRNINWGAKGWRWLGWFLAVNNGLALLALAFVPFARTVQFYEGVYRQIPPNARSFELYTNGRDPYEVLGTPIHFYRPKGLAVRRFQDHAEIAALLKNRDEPLWLFDPRFELPAEVAAKIPSCAPSYQTLPGWVRAFNWGGWLERANVWTLYRCTPERS